MMRSFNKLTEVSYQSRFSFQMAKAHAAHLLGTPYVPHIERIQRVHAWRYFCEALYWRRVQREMEVQR